MKPNVKIGEWYSNQKLKQIMRRYFLDNNINKVAKATSIKDYYIVKDKQVREFGVQIEGKLIISSI